MLAGEWLIQSSAPFGRALPISSYGGEVLGVIELPDSVFMAPVVADNSLYFLTEGGKLMALR